MDGLWYIVLATVAVVAAVAVRVAAGRVPLPKTAAPAGAIDVAYLNGGAPLAVLAALAACAPTALFEGLDGRLVRATGEVAADREPLNGWCTASRNATTQGSTRCPCAARSPLSSAPCGNG